MPVKYTKEKIAAADAAGLKLVTLSAAGLEFSEAVTEDQESEIIRFILDQRAKFKSGGRAATPSILPTTSGYPSWFPPATASGIVSGSTSAPVNSPSPNPDAA